MAPTIKSSLLTKACTTCGQTYQPLSVESTPAHVCPRAAPDATLPPASGNDDDNLVGAILAERYHLERIIDKGGMGIVYAARHTILSSPLAVKVMRQHRGSESLERFFREAQLASKLRHPNIVYIQDFGLLPNGLPYLVMEMVPGNTLASLLKRGSLDATRACRIATQVARGMQIVHATGIVHRDLKPENIIISENAAGDIVKIIDFGIAKELLVRKVPEDAQAANPAALTHTGAFIGSPRYTSPEQAQSQEVDARGDIYSLGCILYQMLTGTPPFQAESDVDLLWMHIKQPVEPPRQRKPGLDISASLEALVLHTLAKRKEERPPSMEALSRALAQEVELRTGYSFFGLRRRGLTAVALGVLIAGLVAGLAYHFASAPHPLSPEEVKQYRKEAIDTLRLLVKSSPQSPQLVEAALTALAQSREPALEPELAASLKASDVQVQRAAAEALGQLGESSALPALHRRLGEPGPPMLMVTVAQALDNLGEPDGLAFLESALRGPDADLSRAAALALCSRRSSAVRAQASALTAQAASSTDDLPLLTCLAHAGDKAARKRLLFLFEQAAQAEKRFIIASRLLELGEASGLDFLRGLLHQPNPQQLAAARLLAAPTEPETAVLFRRTLNDARATAPARLLAAEGLGLSGQLEDLRQLRLLLAPAIDAESRVVAARSMLQLITNDPVVAAKESLLWVRSALSDARPELRETAVDILAQDTEHNVVPVLLEMVKDENPLVRQQAVRALGQRANLPELREALAPVLKNGTEVEQALARSQLLRLGDRGQLPLLSSLRQASAIDVRRTVVRENSALPELLRGFLSDSDWRVRWAAAAALADFGNKEAVPVLKEAIERGGPEALAAYHRLLKLKIPVASPPSINRFLDSEVTSQRIDAVEAMAGLPAELSAPLLVRAARDPEPLVRLMVVTVLSGQVEEASGRRPEAALYAVLRTLTLDSNTVVRMRAQAIYNRLLLAQAEMPAKSDGDSKRSPPLLPIDQELLTAAKTRAKAADNQAAAVAAPVPTPAPKDAAHGLTLTITAPTAIWFRVDRRPWMLASHLSLGLPPGFHSVLTIDKTQTVDLRDAQEVKLDESTLEQLVRSGLRVLAGGDLRKGQHSLERVQAICARDHRIDQPCAALSYDLSFRLAGVYEEQGRWADAMKELQRLSQLGQAGKNESVKARPQQQAAVVTAMGRLGARLGQVVLVGPKNKRGVCEESTLWLAPGSHSINHGGKTFTVQVRAKEKVRVGTCG